MMAQLVPQDYELIIRQQPRNGCVALTKGKDRRPLDPPPIVQLRISNRADPIQKFLQNPYLILVARLVPKISSDDSDDKQRSEVKTGDLAGTVVSSLYNLKDLNNTQGGFFIFGDLSVKKEGTFRLEFILFELRTATRECWQLSSKVSDEFNVYASKNFPGLQESTFLTRSFSDQGVRLRLRKDSRTVLSRKRTASNAQQVDQMKEHPMGGYSMHHDNGAHDLSPQGQSPHLPRRPSALGSPYDNSYELSYDRPHKRMRQHSGSEHSGYDNGYSSYVNPSPRTMPEPMVSYSGPMTTSYQLGHQPTASALPMPAPMTFASIGRLDTQIPPHTGPNSASSTFSPGTRRSPGAAYPYPPAPAPPIHISPLGMYGQAGYMSQHAEPGTLSHSSNIPTLDMDGKP
ncbi:velvet factor-domain-containing protein [Cladorrhinum sp. PSN332]|nr:velvet factor-domain-containing protein [Cladorrhinum sp. PSN332]